MAGLDPAIHQKRMAFLRSKMDARPLLAKRAPSTLTSPWLEDIGRGLLAASLRIGIEPSGDIYSELDRIQQCGAAKQGRRCK